MKSKAEELRDELARVTREYEQRFPGLVAVFPGELIQRVVEYIREEMSQGKSVSECSQELGVGKTRLHYWLYGRSKRIGVLSPAPVLRPVQVSSEMVPVYDGVRERRYVVRSPAGWEIRELTLEELTQLLRRLA